jgi:hypothetical protein
MNDSMFALAGHSCQRRSSAATNLPTGILLFATRTCFVGISTGFAASAGAVQLLQQLLAQAPEQTAQGTQQRSPHRPLQEE